MDVETSNAIRLFFPNPSLVQVFFEAVANSLDAGATEITVAFAWEMAGFSLGDVADGEMARKPAAANTVYSSGTGERVRAFNAKRGGHVASDAPRP
jgi:hypothetical protein